MYESGENYLETIYVLLERHGEVRSIDIARELSFSKPSVSRAVGILKASGYIVIDDRGYITLTETGREKALGIYKRHEHIKNFLSGVLRVSEKVAEEDACRIEHIISEETFQAIEAFVKTTSR